MNNHNGHEDDMDTREGSKMVVEQLLNWFSRPSGKSGRGKRKGSRRRGKKVLLSEKAENLLIYAIDILPDIRFVYLIFLSIAIMIYPFHYFRFMFSISYRRRQPICVKLATILPIQSTIVPTGKLDVYNE